MDIQVLHEQYNPPAVGVGEYVLVRIKGRNCWVGGFVEPPQTFVWKPGDPIGKRITVYVPRMNKIIEDIVHIGDPLHTRNSEIYHTVWETCVPGQVRNAQSAMLELEGRVGTTRADLDEAKKKIASQEIEISKLKAAQSFRGKRAEKEELAAVA